MSSPKLLSPIEIGDLQLKNRVFMAPMTRARSGNSRVPNERMAEYYAQRASSGLIITEATTVTPYGLGWMDSPGIWTEEMREAWKKVIEAVHAKGGKIFCQLWHTGRAGHSSFIPEGKTPVSASAISIGQEVHTADGSKVPHETPRPLELDELPGVIEAYRRGAELAKEAGFDGVEIHSANGYLLDQFLQTCSNQRTDAYGGSVENRFRLLKEVTEAVLTVWPSARVSVRISPNGAFNGMGSEDNIETFTYVAEQLQQYNLGFLHVMDGLGFGYHEKCPAMTLADVRKVYKGIIVGNVGYTQETAEAAIASGDADAIAFGRPYLSNPDLVERFANGWPLAPMSDPATWYTPRDDGYTDFPVYKPEEEAAAETATASA